MKTNPNDPAQPTTEVGPNGEVSQGFGLTKREAMAMAAMQGMYHNGVMTEYGQISRVPETIATYAARAADALIEALNKQGK